MTTRTATRPNFFRVNFTDEAEFLSGLALGTLSAEDGTRLATIMSDHDPKFAGLWINDKDKPCDTNVCNAEVFLNGPNHNDLPTNPLFNRVVGINLGDATRVYLHFNQ
ncbi:hypothetical protein D3C85_341530 [compost metagenome]